jgi:hypothetical protein
MAKAKRTPTVKYPSECRNIEDSALRRRAYQRAVFVNKRWQDSLSTRITAGVELAEIELDELMGIIGSRCRVETKEVLRARLSNVAALPNFGIFSRVMFEDRGVSYCAGQDYGSEIATVRRCIITGK